MALSEKKLDRVIERLQHVFVYLADEPEAQAVVTEAIESVLRDNSIMQFTLQKPQDVIK